MKDSGVRQDDPEYLKAYNILSAVQQQKAYAKQRQVYQQQQTQHQAQQRQQQQNVANAPGTTNGVNGIVSYQYIEY
jgi:ATP-dependent helicase STH1/SNF2